MNEEIKSEVTTTSPDNSENNTTTTNEDKNKISDNHVSKHERDTAIYDLVHGKTVYVLAFLVPIIIMVAIYMIRDIFPFGENCYLRSDMYHQYAPFFSQLWEKIRSGESLSYSWDIGMGTNFTAIYGYYLSSPINWFIALFPQKYLIEIMNIIIILKLAASSLTCTYYLCSHHKKRHLSAAIFGLFYALSAFIAAYSWNLMWLDCVLLLPLVFLGIERLANEGKGLLYVIALGLTILSNYYISIMVCISSVLYFAVALVSRPVMKDVSDYARTILKFLGYSLLAGGLAAVLLLPEVYALQYTASGNVNFPTTMTRYFSFITMISRHLMNVDVSIGLDHLPNIYCGVAVLILFPMYIITKKIPRREKVMKVIVLIVFFTAFNLNIPNFIWHGFHYPNSLPCRQSFIYIFLLLTMCYDAVANIKSYKNSQITASFWGVLLFLLYLGNTIVTEDFDFKIIYTSAVFIAIYVLFIFLSRKRKINICLLTLVLFIVAIVECSMNMENTGYSTTSRTYYLSDYDSVNTLTDEIENAEGADSFYRVSKVRGARSKNDASWHHFHGSSTFSSTAYAHMTTLLGQLGLEHSTNAYSESGATPLINSIFGIKYFLSNVELNDNNLIKLLDKVDSEYLYVNNYTLPLAFMLPSDFNTNWLYENDANPFEVQNSFAQAAAGISNLFTPISFDDASTTATIIPVTGSHLYLYVMNKKVDTVNVTIDGTTTRFTGVNHGRMIDVGYVDAGADVYVTDADNQGISLQLYAYTMDENKFIQLYESLADEGLEITEFEETDIKGTITAKTDGLMYTSIPYDEGFTLYIDGEKTEYTTVGDALIAVDLTAGTHTIEFKYAPRGLSSGIILSVICVLILGGLIAFRIKYKKEISEPDAILLLKKPTQERK